MTRGMQLLELAATPYAGPGDAFDAAIGEASQLADRMGGSEHIAISLHLTVARRRGEPIAHDGRARLVLWQLGATADLVEGLKLPAD